MSKKLTRQEFIDNATAVHGKKFDYSGIDYKNNYTPIIIVCHKHGAFYQKPNNHTNGAGCIKCSREARLSSADKFINKAKQIHGNAYDYSAIKYKNNRSKLEIICPTHGPFFQIPGHHRRGAGCPKCANDRSQYHAYTAEEFIRIAKNKHADKYDYSRVKYNGAYNKIEIVCPLHGSFLQTACNHLRGGGCKKCSFIISKKEIRFLDTLGIKEENRQIKIPTTEYSVDGFDPITNTVYEFLGDRWHGNPKVYNKHKIFRISTLTTFGDLYKKTLRRFSQLRDLGYNIKYVWENDWKAWEKTGEGIPPLKEYKK